MGRGVVYGMINRSIMIAIGKERLMAALASCAIVVGEIGPQDWAVVKGIVQIRKDRAIEAGVK